MPELHTTFSPNLSPFSDETLDEIFADGQVFASRAWFRMFEGLDLSSLTGGAAELEYAVVWEDDAPIAVCPVLHASGPGIYFVYSIRQFFFEHWIEDAVRLDPSKRDHFTRLFAIVSAYKKFLEWTGSPLEKCLLVTNPLSYRGEASVAPSASSPRAEVYAHLVEALQRHSCKHRRPLWFAFVAGDNNRFGDALAESGCEKVFQFYDNCLDLDAFGTFEDYMQSFRRTTRRAFQKDMRKTSDAGVTFRFDSHFSTYSSSFTSLYGQTYQKYGASFFRQPPTFWEAIERSLGGRAEAITAWHNERLVGFSILLHSERRGEMFTYRIGRSAQELDDVPYYFGLSYYAPIQRAIERGCRRIWLGPASYEAKSVRGARQAPLNSYFWFPRRIDRWTLLPYLRLFGNISKEQIEKSIDRPLRALDSDVIPQSNIRKELP